MAQRTGDPSVLTFHWGQLPLMAGGSYLICLFPVSNWMVGFTIEDGPVHSMAATLACFIPTTLVIHCFMVPLLIKSSAINVFMRCIGGIFCATMFFWTIAVLFGAPLLSLVPQTVLWALLEAAIVALPCAAVLGSSTDTWLRLFIDANVQTMADAYCAIPAMGATAGAWLGAIPIPLDWDRPWQAWPITLVYGAAAGYAVGLGFTYFLWWRWQLRATRIKKF